jgi:hypothetical protein
MLRVIASVRGHGPSGFVQPHVASLCAFALGASLAMSFLSNDWGRDLVAWAKVALVGAVCTAIWRAPV